jgi:two-component system sensor histidine kinase/response regulator
MEENKVTLTKVEFSLRNIVEESLDIVSFLASKSEIELVADISPNLQDKAIGDDSRLRQVMVNLLVRIM